MKKRSLVFLGVAALATTGCQYATQTVILKPTLAVTQTGLPETREVRLKVEDDRPEQGLGRRTGGYGDGAEIKLGNDVVAAVHESVTQGLQKLNVSVGGNGQTSPISLTVTLRALKYVGSSGMFTFGSNVEGMLRVQGTAGEKAFDKRYTLQKEAKRSAVVTTSDFNEKLLNDGLSELINQFLNDPDLIAFLK